MGIDMRRPASSPGSALVSCTRPRARCRASALEGRVPLTLPSPATVCRDGDTVTGTAHGPRHGRPDFNLLWRQGVLGRPAVWPGPCGSPETRVELPDKELTN